MNNRTHAVLSEETARPLVVFDGAGGFLKWRDKWAHCNWIVILDRTEPRFTEAVQVVNEKYLSRIAEGNVRLPGPLPPLRRFCNFHGGQMKNVSLDSTTAVYDCARLANIEVHNIDDAEFHRFCLSLIAFERSLGESASDDYWKPFLRTLKRYRFDISSTPLPFDYAMNQGSNLVERLRGQLGHCKLIYPRFADSAQELVDRVLAVRGSHSNPILAVCADIAGCSGVDVAMLIKEPRLIPAVEQLLCDASGIGPVEVIGQTQLKGHSCYSTLIVIGPARWYGDYVFQSPRAHQIHIVKYRWINDGSPSSRVFTGSSKLSGDGCVGIGGVVSTSTKESPVPPNDSLNPEDFLPSIDWDDILRRVSARTVGDPEQADDGEEYVTALLFQLEGEIVVPLDASEGARATVLMLTQENTNPVQRIPVTNIEPGMFLLVRTRGGGEYIVLVADGILGERSDSAREAQRDWKDHLRRKVLQDGLRRVVHSLERYGSRRANQVNVRNWMSYRTIKTEDQRDFRAIMNLIGLPERFDEYWQKMTLIDNAHRRAGQLIRRQLLAEVRSADLDGLEKLGRMEFDLPGVEGINLTAVRIEDIHPQTFEIDVAKLGHPFELDGNPWLG